VSATAVGTRPGRAALDAARRAAWTQAFRAWGTSRVLVWAAGLTALLVFGAHAGPHDPLHATTPFGGLGDKLVAPVARWDSVWYLLIADHGYVSTRATQFFPLYPLTARAAGIPFGSSLVGGLAVSLASLLAALYLLQRLAARELGAASATRTTLLLAYFPAAVFLSAVYTEGLFLALSIGAVYAARTGRWTLAGLAGGLAAMTRPSGLLVVVPLLLLYLYGPRDDRLAPAAAPGRLRPRYQLAPDVAWLLAVPAGLACYLAYLWAKFGDPFVLAGQGAAWGRNFTLPFVTVWHAAQLAGSGALQVFHGRPPDNIYEFGFFCFACIATVGAFRRLPVAYGAYAAIGLAFIVSFPVAGERLVEVSRYMMPLFPILMWLAVWSSERRLFKWIFVAFALLMILNSARFATWHFGA
jgi:hypothetical protein